MAVVVVMLEKCRFTVIQHVHVPSIVDCIHSALCTISNSSRAHFCHVIVLSSAASTHKSASSCFVKSLRLPITHHTPWSMMASAKQWEERERMRYLQVKVFRWISIKHFPLLRWVFASREGREGYEVKQACCIMLFHWIEAALLSLLLYHDGKFHLAHFSYVVDAWGIKD